MTTHLEQELEKIKIKFFKMADLAADAVSNAIKSLQNRDIDGAKKIIEDDSILDKLEMDIDDECIRVLVTKQPAATDLRFVLSMLKINTDLERIGDLASNIAKETIRLDGKPFVKPLNDIPDMAEISIDMIKKSVQAISNKDVDLARKIIKMDDQIDEKNLQVFKELFALMNEDSDKLPQALGLVMVAKALERIGDHTTNIAERAIYYVDGVDIRHGSDIV